MHSSRTHQQTASNILGTSLNPNPVTGYGGMPGYSSGLGNHGNGNHMGQGGMGSGYSTPQMSSRSGYGAAVIGSYSTSMESGRGGNYQPTPVQGGAGGGGSHYQQSALAKQASAREQLFSSRPAADSNGGIAALGSPADSQQQQYPPMSARTEDTGPLQLEHFLGYSGTYLDTALTVPGRPDLVVKGEGGLVVVENLYDTHAQRFLRGHDMPVCALTVSSSGRYTASGQLGTIHHKGHGAPVLLWSLETGAVVHAFRGLTFRVMHVSISPDERFLLASGEDCLLYIWEIRSGEVVFAQKLSHPMTTARWVEQRTVLHDQEYELALVVNNILYQGILSYDSMRMQWNLRQRAFQMPPTGGLIRVFYSLAMSADRLFLFVGTSSGEMMVFRRDTCVFRACLPVCTNGVHALVVLPDGTVVGGGGDGSLVRLYGQDMTWQKVEESRLDGVVRSLALSASQQDMIAVTTTGSVYQIATANLSQSRVVSASNTGGLSSISFGTFSETFPPPPTAIPQTVFVTGTMNGEVRVWNLLDYSCMSTYRQPKAGVVKCVVLVPSLSLVLSGWEDGAIRCTDLNGSLLWQIPTAHRDGTLTLDCHVSDAMQYFASGGGDGTIRIWRMSSRELITQYTEHRKGVHCVVVDRVSPHLVHSAGGDCTVLTYDLKAAKRVMSHMVKSGTMHAMTQRKDHEQEIITVDNAGQILQWDIDYRDPVAVLRDGRNGIMTCQVSPSGRFLAIAGVDQLVKVIDISSQSFVAIGQSHTGTVTSLSWTPDEKQLLTGGLDSCLTVWNFYLGGAM